ncbi:DUF2470 domain-containing protein [Dactylosporangium sp. AC04546]|uniref:DUF2470 domain-containing protein n=1 Tax=Dactylosporangium sp. AC04546 TaxID=2862460 RepID=UPI001EDDFFA5|nr:DUF2470 domain-containing protein [Dactylosporangium sp. AC04546]WVK88959.1 DUF2470 domain-containing protein [Dactylosporangium sp. AC04546]
MASATEPPSALAGSRPSTDAVEVRSALATCTSLRLEVAGTAADLIDAHTVLPDGTIVVAVDAMTRLGGLLVAARGADHAVRLDVTHLVPVPVRARVRARVTVTGSVRRMDPAVLDSCDDGAVMSLLGLPPVALWTVEPGSVHVERHGAGAEVAVAAYYAARPDPVATVEAVHLARLIRHHRDAAHRLAALVDPELAATGARLVPVAVDADGLTLRAETVHRHDDVRLPFRVRVTDEATLDRELRRLLPDNDADRPEGA